MKIMNNAPTGSIYFIIQISLQCILLFQSKNLNKKMTTFRDINHFLLPLNVILLFRLVCTHIYLPIRLPHTVMILQLTMITLIYLSLFVLFQSNFLPLLSTLTLKKKLLPLWSKFFVNWIFLGTHFFLLIAEKNLKLTAGLCWNDGE